MSLAVRSAFETLFLAEGYFSVTAGSFNDVLGSAGSASSSSACVSTLVVVVAARSVGLGAVTSARSAVLDPCTSGLGGRVLDELSK